VGSRGFVVVKIFYDKMTDEEFSRANESLSKPGIIMAHQLGINEKIALRIFLGIAANRVGTVHIICTPLKDTGLEPQIRPFESGFPPEPRQYTYATALKFDKPIQVERMTIEERDALLAQRNQNRSEG
jgi:hypothetical protein